MPNIYETDQQDHPEPFIGPPAPGEAIFFPKPSARPTPQPTSNPAENLRATPAPAPTANPIFQMPDILGAFRNFGRGFLQSPIGQSDIVQSQLRGHGIDTRQKKYQPEPGIASGLGNLAGTPAELLRGPDLSITDANTGAGRIGNVTIPAWAQLGGLFLGSEVAIPGALESTTVKLAAKSVAQETAHVVGQAARAPAYPFVGAIPGEAGGIVPIEGTSASTTLRHTADIPPVAKGPPSLGSGTTTSIRQLPPSKFNLEPFTAPADRLEGPTTGFESAAQKVHGLREVYGALDPAAIHYSEPVAKLSIQKAVFEETQKARAHLAVLDWYAGAKDVMGFDSKGVATKVAVDPGAVQGPLRGTIMDIIEKPLRYRLTPAQQAVVDEAKAIMGSVRSSEKAVGIDFNDVADYWARIITGSPNEAKTLLGKLKVAMSTPGMATGKGHTFERSFQLAEDAVKAGYKINTSPVETLTARLDAGIQAISLAETRSRITSLPGVTKGAPGFGEGTILGKSAPRETIDEIKSWMELPEFSSGTSGRNLGAQFLQAYRSVLTSFDLGSATLQTGRVVWRNPVAWTRAVKVGLEGMAREPLSYVAANHELIDRGIKNGAIVPPSEFLFPNRGLANKVAGTTIGKAPTIPGKVYSAASLPLRASNRFMEWNIFAAQTELYRAAEAAGGKSIEELVSLGRQIRHATGTESYAVLGVSRRQQAVEAVALFAPRFMRAIVNEIAQAFTLGSGGAAARRSLASAVAGMTALTLGVNALQHRGTNVDDPRQENWMRAKVGNSWVSFFGPLHNYFRTVARIAYYSTQGDVSRGGVAKPDSKRAALEAARFVQSKEGIALGFLVHGGRIIFSPSHESANFENQPITASPQGLLNLARDSAPITPVNIATEMAKGNAESLLNIANVNINPESPNFTFKKYVESQVGVPYDQITDRQRQFYEYIEPVGKKLHAEREQRYANTPPDLQYDQDTHEQYIQQALASGRPVSEMTNDLKFLWDLGVKPSRIKDPSIRPLYTDFAVFMTLVKEKDYWNQREYVSLYKSDAAYRLLYDRYLRMQAQGMRELAMPFTRMQLNLVKGIDALVEERQKAIRRDNPDLDAALIRYGYVSKPLTGKGAIERMKQMEQASSPVGASRQ